MISPFNKFLCVLLTFFISAGSFITNGNNSDDIKTVTENITNGLLSGTIGAFSGSDIKDGDAIIAAAVSDEDGDLYFPDVDYKSKERTSWAPAKHIARTERLAFLFRTETDEAKKEEYKKAVISLLDYWEKHDYQSDNWWYNRLSNPNVLGEIGVLMKNDLSRKQIRKLAELVGRGSYVISPVLADHTGANAIDLAMSTIKYGALTGNRRAVKKAVKVISSELKYSDDEGLKSDSTFFQHGKRIYMGGYGIEFISGMTNLMAMLSGTKYIFTQEQLKPFACFILDGLRIMSFGSTLDPTTMGRSVSRKNSQPLKGAATSLARLADIEEMPRRNEIKAYVDSIRNDTKTDYGVKYYDVAKFLVINNSDFYFSFRGGDDELVYSEIINDENVLSYNSSFPGVTTIMHTGNEYSNIAPVYDYSHVPGTTAVYETDEELFAHEDYTYRYLDCVYGSASADGKAASAVRTSHEGIDMTVSCFATDNAAILLGAGMKDSKGRSMNTTLDQCFYAGSFSRDGNTVIHNGIKYTVLEGGKLSAWNEHRTGDWHRNNLPMASEAAEGDIFTVAVENTGSYAYTVMSENTDEEFKVIANNEKVQAVLMPDGTAAAAFFEKAEFSWNGKTCSGKAGEVRFF